MNSLPILQLRRGKDESLRRFHPWVFSGAIARCDEGIEDGDLVIVNDAEGNFIAKGHYQRGTIMVRVLTFDNEDVNHDFWVRRLRKARCVREAAGGG